MTIADELGKATDEMNKVILDVEQLLRDLKLGVPAKIALDSDLYLSFMKWGNKWQLVTLEERGADDIIEPLVNANRRVRLKALDKLPLLKHEMEKEARETLADVTDAIEQTKKEWGLE